MKLLSPAALALVAILVGGVTPVEGRQRHKWWESGDVKTELSISDDQSASIEIIYQSTLPTLRTLMETLNQREEALSELIDAAETTERQVVAQIEQVEAARGALSKERLLMVYRMHRELSVEQRIGLREWMDANRRRPRRSSPRR